ncbi:hypothetical protein SAURM35S_05430 [Streptomyces aurantiogriseus]
MLPHAGSAFVLANYMKMLPHELTEAASSPWRG